MNQMNLFSKRTRDITSALQSELHTLSMVQHKIIQSRRSRRQGILDSNGWGRMTQWFGIECGRASYWIEQREVDGIFINRDVIFQLTEFSFLVHNSKLFLSFIFLLVVVASYFYIALGLAGGVILENECAGFCSFIMLFCEFRGNKEIRKSERVGWWINDVGFKLIADSREKWGDTMLVIWVSFVIPGTLKRVITKGYGAGISKVAIGSEMIVEH